MCISARSPELDVLCCDDASEPVRQEIQRWVALQGAFVLFPQLVLRALREAADLDAVLRLVKRWKPECPSLDGAALQRACFALERHHIQLVPITSKLYPAQLARLSDAPAVLFVRGNVEVLQQTSVAIVGSRASTVYGREVATRLGRALGRAGVSVVSGLARGIDAAAHRGVLEADGITVAIQACGPDRVYPAEHRGLAEELCVRGAMVTEFPPGMPPRPFHFPLRNRVISALARAVIVVEAREKSGSLITAEHALEQGVELMAVPGPITAPTSVGPNRLLRDGAAPVLEPDDVFHALGLADGQPVTPQAASSAIAGLSEIAQDLFQALAQNPLSREELARNCQRPPEQIALGLVELELEGIVVEDRDGRLGTRSR